MKNGKEKEGVQQLATIVAFQVIENSSLDSRGQKYPDFGYLVGFVDKYM